MSTTNRRRSQIDTSTIKRVAVLGAGYMGGAITFPLSDSGHIVRLWGTWLDDDIIDSCRSTIHPKLGIPLRQGVETFHSNSLAEAVDDVQCIFIAVSSDGFVPVLKRLFEVQRLPCSVFCLTKGFVEEGRRVKRLSEWAAKELSKRVGEDQFGWVSVGGPVKAVELSRMVPSASVYGVSGASLREVSRHFSTQYYRIVRCDDVAGVELSSAFKNVYAVGLGICDGIYKQRSEAEYHNICAILFNQGVAEISTIVEQVGGDRSTVYGLAGLGDLYVTGRSGRNRKYGELIGAGGQPEETYERMILEGDLAEGYDALAKGVRWWEKEQKRSLDELPLLKTLHRIVINRKKPEKEIYSFVKWYGS